MTGIERGVTEVEVGSADEDALRAERTERVQRLAGGVASWTLLGFVLGAIGPGVAVLVLVGGELMFGVFVAGSTAVGVLGGVLLGVLDVPGRLVRPGQVGDALVVRVMLSGVFGLVAGVVWTALAGGVAALLMLSSPVLLAPGPFGQVGISNDMLLSMASLGAALGALVGTPGVVLFCVLRAVSLARRWPWWVAVVGVGGAAVLTGALSVPVYIGFLGG